jgi:hypothetical protein
MYENVTFAAYTEMVRPMPKKQVIVKETAVAATPARTAKPKTPRVRTTKHSKAVSTEPVVIHMDTRADTLMEAAQSNPENSREAIAQIAYGYWESRGYSHGGALEDWVRAEHDYRQRMAATRL